MCYICMHTVFTQRFYSWQCNIIFMSTYRLEIFINDQVMFITDSQVTGSQHKQSKFFVTKVGGGGVHGPQTPGRGSCHDISIIIYLVSLSSGILRCCHGFGLTLQSLMSVVVSELLWWCIQVKWLKMIPFQELLTWLLFGKYEIIQ